MRLSRPQQLVYEMDRFGGGSIATITTSILFDEKLKQSTCINAIHVLYEINATFPLVVIAKMLATIHKNLCRKLLCACHKTLGLEEGYQDLLLLVRK